MRTEFGIEQASKKCMGLEDLEGCYSGRADIVLLVPVYDGSGRQVAVNALVWEVKAFSRRGLAQPEAMHYADRMRGKPLTGGNVPVTSAVIGWNIGGPCGGVGGYPKTKYWSASRNGVVIYGDSDNRKVKNFLHEKTSDAEIQLFPRTATPSTRLRWKVVRAVIAVVEEEAVRVGSTCRGFRCCRCRCRFLRFR